MSASKYTSDNNAQTPKPWRRIAALVASILLLAGLVILPVSQGADDDLMLYPLEPSNYGRVLRVSGVADPGRVVKIEANGVVVAKTVANESGDFAVAFVPQRGMNTVQAVEDGALYPARSDLYRVRHDPPLAFDKLARTQKDQAAGKTRIVAFLAVAAPVITTQPATTTSNPITLSGTAPAGTEVNFYVNGRYTRKVVATAGSTFSTWVPLEDGLNSVYAIATNGPDTSPASNTVQITYANSIVRTYAASTISVPTVWTAGSTPTYTLNGALTIAAGATLWIQPGVTVKVSGAYKILANGSFVVRGTSTARSVLRPTQVLCTDTSPRRITDWPGVETGTASGNVSLEYADIYCATNGVYFNLGTGSLAYTRVLNGGTGVRTLSTAGAPILPPQIVGQNELQGNSNGIYVGAFSSPNVTGNNLITGNTIGISVYGNTSAGTTQNPLPVVNGNSLYANTTNYSATNFINPATTILNAQGNWWGTADPSAILATIQDRNLGGTTRPYVNYGGFLGAAGGTSAYTGPTLIGPITANTTLAAGTYLMLSDIVVNATRTWTIAPGAEIRSAAGRKILVNGTLQANGSSTQRVRFSSAKPYPAVADWAGIEVSTGGIANLDYARIEHAIDGVYFNAGQGTIAHSLIRFCTTGVYVGAKSNPTINQGNEISNNTHGIYVRGPTNTSASAENPLPIINGNSLFANTAYNLYTTSFAAPRPTLNATGNWWGTAVTANIAATIFTIGSSSTPVDSSGFLTVEPFLPAITLTGFSMSTQEAKPLVSIQPAAGTFTLNRAGTVTFKIMRDADSAIVRQWSQSFVAGQNAFSWDGRNDLAAIVPGGLYRVLLTATNGVDPIDYDAPVPSPVSGNTAGIGNAPSTFNPYTGQLYKLNVTFQKPTLAWLRVSPQGGNEFYVFTNVFYPAGVPHWLYWDGRGPDGQMLTVPATVWAGDGTIMRANGIYVLSPTVAITGLNAAPNIEVRSDPFLVASSYEQASRIVYRVSLDALVRVTILPPGVVDPASPSAIVLVNNVTQPAKDGNGNPIDHTAEWRGYSAADPNAALAGAEGAYTFAIEATLPATGQKTLYRGILNIAQ